MYVYLSVTKELAIHWTDIVLGFFFVKLKFKNGGDQILVPLMSAGGVAACFKYVKHHFKIKKKINVSDNNNPTNYVYSNLISWLVWILDVFLSSAATLNLGDKSNFA